MNSSGISRRIDELGRIVIPVEIRRMLNIKEGENIEFTIKDGSLILTKKQFLETNIDVINSMYSSLLESIDGDFLITDREKIILSSNKEYLGSLIDNNISELLKSHEIYHELNNIIINKSQLDHRFYLFPYSSFNNILGFIIIYNVDNIDKYKKMVKFIISYISFKTSLS